MILYKILSLYYHYPKSWPQPKYAKMKQLNRIMVSQLLKSYFFSGMLEVVTFSLPILRITILSCYFLTITLFSITEVAILLTAS